MKIRKEILDELIRDYKNPEDLLGEDGLLKQLTKALLERAMQAELTHDLGYEKNDKSSLKENGNRRNGTSAKTVKSKHGEIELGCSARSAFRVRAGDCQKASATI